MPTQPRRARLAAATLALFTATAPAAQAGDPPPGFQLQRNGSKPAQKGPPETFTGQVRIERLFLVPPPGRVQGASVTFEPGARTFWHSHPLGQTLIVTAGLGWTQCGNGPVVELRPGDVTYCPPNIRHWHGASASNAMTHLAIYEGLDGKFVDWAEAVSDADYHGP